MDFGCFAPSISWQIRLEGSQKGPSTHCRIGKGGAISLAPTFPVVAKVSDDAVLDDRAACQLSVAGTR